MAAKRPQRSPTYAQFASDNASPATAAAMAGKRQVGAATRGCPVEEHLSTGGRTSSSRIGTARKPRSSAQRGFMRLGRAKQREDATPPSDAASVSRASDAFSPSSDASASASSAPTPTRVPLVPETHDPTDTDHHQPPPPRRAAAAARPMWAAADAADGAWVAGGSGSGSSGGRRGGKRTKWTPSDDQLLRATVADKGAKNWKEIAKAFGGRRSDVQCMHRWNKVLKPGLHKGPWSAEEDQVVYDEVMQKGVTNVKWSTIASMLQGRIGKQCRERWFNHLDPTISRAPWGQQEDELILEAQREVGNKWCEIAKLLPGRTENAVKNRWNSAAHRRLQQSQRREGDAVHKGGKRGVTLDSLPPEARSRLAGLSAALPSLPTPPPRPVSAAPEIAARAAANAASALPRSSAIVVTAADGSRIATTRASGRSEVVRRSSRHSAPRAGQYTAMQSLAPLPPPPQQPLPVPACATTLPGVPVKEEQEQQQRQQQQAQQQKLRPPVAAAAVVSLSAKSLAANEAAAAAGDRVESADQTALRLLRAHGTTGCVRGVRLLTARSLLYAEEVPDHGAGPSPAAEATALSSLLRSLGRCAAVAEAHARQGVAHALLAAHAAASRAIAETEAIATAATAATAAAYAKEDDATLAAAALWRGVQAGAGQGGGVQVRVEAAEEAAALSLPALARAANDLCERLRTLQARPVQRSADMSMGGTRFGMHTHREAPALPGMFGRAAEAAAEAAEAEGGGGGMPSGGGSGAGGGVGGDGEVEAMGVKVDAMDDDLYEPLSSLNLDDPGFPVDDDAGGVGGATAATGQLVNGAAAERAQRAGAGTGLTPAFGRMPSNSTQRPPLHADAQLPSAGIADLRPGDADDGFFRSQGPPSVGSGSARRNLAPLRLDSESLDGSSLGIPSPSAEAYQAFLGASPHRAGKRGGLMGRAVETAFAPSAGGTQAGGGRGSDFPFRVQRDGSFGDKDGALLSPTGSLLSLTVDATGAGSGTPLATADDSRRWPAQASGADTNLSIESFGFSLDDT